MGVKKIRTSGLSETRGEKVGAQMDIIIHELGRIAFVQN